MSFILEKYLKNGGKILRQYKIEFERPDDTVTLIECDGHEGTFAIDNGGVSWFDSEFGDVKFASHYEDFGDMKAHPISEIKVIKIEENLEFLEGFRVGARLKTIADAKDAWEVQSDHLQILIRAEIESHGWHRGYAAGDNYREFCESIN
jgi:hypothetical protein